MTKKNMKNQTRNFVDDRFKDPDFTGWLMKVKEDETKICCLIYHKTIQFSTSEISALTDHAKGKKYTEVIDRRKTFLNQSLPHPQCLTLPN